jgi:hypothetical protein
MSANGISIRKNRRTASPYVQRVDLHTNWLVIASRAEHPGRPSQRGSEA